MLYYLFGGKAFKLVLPAGCMSLIAKKCDFPHLLVSSKDDVFYFQMNHTKTQEKELLGIKSYSLNFIFFLQGYCCFLKSGATFSLSTHPA